MFQTKVVEKIKTHFMSNNFFFSKIVLFMRYAKNIAESDRPQLTIRRIRIACWIHKAIDTHSEYVILIAFPLQQWLRELASLIRHRYITCLSCKFNK
jgi:hypothetical protein